MEKQKFNRWTKFDMLYNTVMVIIHITETIDDDQLKGSGFHSQAITVIIAIYTVNDVQ